MSMGNFKQQEMMEIHIHFLFQKELTLSDTSNHQCKLIIPKKDVEERFLTFWTREQIKEGVPLQVFDMDEGRELLNEIFILKYHESCDTYVFQNGWHQFVRRKNLKDGHIVEFRWNSWSSRILFNTHQQDPAPPGKIYYFSASFNLFLSL